MKLIPIILVLTSLSVWGESVPQKDYEVDNVTGDDFEKIDNRVHELDPAVLDDESTVNRRQRMEDTNYPSKEMTGDDTWADGKPLYEEDTRLLKEDSKEE